MATITDIYTALIPIITDAVYPSGTANPSIINAPVTRRPGYPDPNRLDVLLAEGNAHIGIFAVGNSDKNVTRFQEYDQTVSINTATIFATVNNNQVILSGTVSVPQAVLIILNKVTYAYSIQASDTLADIAATLALQIPSANAVGDTITISGSVLSLIARVATQGTSLREIKRQRKLFYVTVYAASPDDREKLADSIDVALGNAKRIFFDDTTSCNIFYKGAQEIDNYQKTALYQRNLIYTIEYSTVITDTYMTIQSEQLNLSQL